MEKRSEEEVELKHYLLGEVGEDERWAVEERLFLDREYLLRFRALEDELIDAYVHGDLPPGEQDKVESELLSRPGRDEDLKFARALKDYLDDAEDETPIPAAADSGPQPYPTPKPSFPFPPPFIRRYPVAAFSLAAAVLVIIAVVIWQASEARRRRDAPLAHAPAPLGQGAPTDPKPPQESGEERADKGAGTEVQPERPGASHPSRGEDGERAANPRPTRQPRQQARPSSPAEQRSSLALTVLLLPSAAARGEGQGNVVHLSPGVGTVNVQLPLFDEGETYSIYNATLRADGKPVHSWAKLKPTVAESGSLVQIPIPAGLLRKQSYEVSLAGVAGNGRAEELRIYSFRVQ